MAKISLVLFIFFASLYACAQTATFTPWVEYGPNFKCQGRCIGNFGSNGFYLANTQGVRSSYKQCSPCMGDSPAGFAAIEPFHVGGFPTNSFLHFIYPAQAFPVSNTYRAFVEVFGDSVNGGFPYARMQVDGKLVEIVAFPIGVPLQSPGQFVHVGNSFNSPVQIVQYFVGDNILLQGGVTHDVDIEVVAFNGQVKGRLYVGQVGLYPHYSSPQSGTSYVGSQCAFRSTLMFTNTPLGFPNRVETDLVNTCQNFAASKGHAGAQIYLNTNGLGPVGPSNCGPTRPQCELLNVQ